mgnify:CR=1 FL=1
MRVKRGNLPDFVPEKFGVWDEVQQCPDEHIARNSRKAVNVKRLHTSNLLSSVSKQFLERVSLSILLRNILTMIRPRAP